MLKLREAYSIKIRFIGLGQHARSGREIRFREIFRILSEGKLNSRAREASKERGYSYTADGFAQRC